MITERYMMRYTIFYIAALFSVGSQVCALPNYQISDISDPAAAEDNEAALNRNYEDYFRFKADRTTDTASAVPPYLIEGLADRRNSEIVTMMLNENNRALYEQKADIDTNTVSAPQYFLDDVLDPEKAEDNNYALGQILRNLAEVKRDK